MRVKNIGRTKILYLTALLLTKNRREIARRINLRKVMNNHP